MIAITPVDYGRGRMAAHIKISILTFPTDALSVNTFYQVFNSDFAVLEEGNIPISEEDYTAWGSSNEIIENIVLSALNLEKIL